MQVVLARWRREKVRVGDPEDRLQRLLNAGDGCLDLCIDKMEIGNLQFLHRSGRRRPSDPEQFTDLSRGEPEPPGEYLIAGDLGSQE